jgi:hypothetical protein
MSRRGWKGTERAAAKLIGGARFPANSGGRIDCQNSVCVVQVKNTARFSLRQIENLVVEMERLGALQHKAGLLAIKRSAGRGRETPMIICMTAATYHLMNGALPAALEPEPEAGAGEPAP